MRLRKVRHRYLRSRCPTVDGGIDEILLLGLARSHNGPLNLPMSCLFCVREISMSGGCDNVRDTHRAYIAALRASVAIRLKSEYMSSSEAVPGSW